MIIGKANLAQDNVPSHWRRLARGAWYPVVAVALGIIIASIPGYIVLVPRGFDLSDRFVDNSSPFILSLNILSGVFSIAMVLLSFYLALVLYRRRPDDRMALFLSYYLLAFGVLVAGPSEALLFFLPGIAIQITQVVTLLITLPMSIFLFALFPDGRFVPGWTRVLGFVSFLVVFIIFKFPRAVIGYSLMFTLLFIMLFAQTYRYRHVSTQLQKQQTKWFVYGLGVLLTLLVIVSIPRTWSYTVPQGALDPIWEAGALLLYFISLAIIPLTLTISVMRYRLYDIDILINRTLVYGALTATTMGIYILIVGYLGNIIQAQDKTFFAFLSTGLIALLFQPLRERLQRIVNRLMYGERSDPVAVLSRLGKQLEETITPHAALSGIVESLAQALKLPYAAVEFGMGDNPQTVTSFGQPPDKVFRFPIVYQAEDIGYLVAAPRSPREPFSDLDETLLENIARQAGAVSHAARLTVDLQRSRERLVTTREEERRRLRRDLHDGIGPTMASQTLKLDAALDLITGDPEAGQEQDLEEAIKILMELKEQTQGSVTNIRRIVYALRPPALDDLGLVPAIQTHVAQQTRTLKNLKVSVETPAQGLPPLSAAIELATYRITLEALTNVINHAQARNCTISLSVSEGRYRRLNLQIVDDGEGLSENHQAGVGLTSMRERAEELGGAFTIESASSKGTRISARIPIITAQGRAKRLENN